MIVNKEGAFLRGNAPSLFYYHYLNKFWVQVLAGPQNGIRHLLTFLCAGTRKGN